VEIPLRSLPSGPCALHSEVLELGGELPRSRRLLRVSRSGSQSPPRIGPIPRICVRRTPATRSPLGFASGLGAALADGAFAAAAAGRIGVVLAARPIWTNSSFWAGLPSLRSGLQRPSRRAAARVACVLAGSALWCLVLASRRVNARADRDSVAAVREPCYRRRSFAVRCRSPREAVVLHTPRLR